MRRPSVPTALPLVAGVLLIAAWPAGLALAADPSASPAAADPTHDPSIEIWQDEPLPPDVPVGRAVDVAFTTWDTRRQALSELNTADVRVHPATGRAAPTAAQTHSDWPGHLLVTITIPTGGLGRIEIGYPGQECHADGTCAPVFVSYTMAGVGPPPEAPRSSLVAATIVPPADPVIVGQPLQVDVGIEPRAAWDPTLLALPASVVLIGAQLSGQSVTQVDMRAVSDGRYGAAITFADPGDTLLTVAFQTAANQLEPIDGSALRLKVQGAATEASPEPSDAGASAPAAAGSPLAGVPVLPIALVGAGLVAAGLIVRRVFADL